MRHDFRGRGPLLFALMFFLLFSAGCEAGAGGAIPALPSATPVANRAANSTQNKNMAEPTVKDELRRLAAAAGLGEIAKGGGTREIRIWTIYEGSVRGLIAGEAAGTFLEGARRQDGSIDLKKAAAAPREGWKVFWQGETASGLLALNNRSAELAAPPPDANMTYIEIRQGTRYRYYGFGGLCYARSAEAAELRELFSQIGSGFGIELVNCSG